MYRSPVSLSHHNSPSFGVGVLGGFSPTVTGITVTVAAIPGCPEGLWTLTFAVTAAPTKFNWVILLDDDTGLFSSNIVIAPGIRPPPTGTQYLLPAYPGTATNWYWAPDGTDDDTNGSDKFGSAWSNPRYWYLSSDNRSCGTRLALPLRYFGILGSAIF